MDRFCGQCGTERAGQARFCISCGAAFATEATSVDTQVPRETTQWERLQTFWWIAGSFNVEGGNAAVSSQYFEGCDCYALPRDGGPCSLCGRDDANSQTCASGQGDGVYPVFVLEDSTHRVHGAVAAFVEEWALGIENKSKSPKELADHASPVRVGAIETSGTVLFNEAITGWNNRDITVDVSLPAGHYEIVAWLAAVPVLQANGMEPFIRPIALGVYGRELMAALDSVTRIDRDPAAFEPYRPWNILTWPVMAHREPRWQDALRYNYHDDSKRGDRQRALSWLLHGELHDDPFSITTLAQLRQDGLSLTEAQNQDLLLQRGQTAGERPIKATDEARVVLAMSSEGPTREQARQQIIDGVDVESMIACAIKARELGDRTDEEFWWLEVATVPAGDEHITRGVIGLCTNVLLPQNRYEEAELYCRHLLVRASPASREQAQNMIERIENLRREAGIVRLVNTGAWREVDVGKPLQPGLSTQQAYDRAFAVIDARSSDGRMDEIANAPRDSFMPYITGWLIGASQSGQRSGLERETLAKVLYDWLTERGCDQLESSGTGPGIQTQANSNPFIKRSPGLG